MRIIFGRKFLNQDKQEYTEIEISIGWRNQSSLIMVERVWYSLTENFDIHVNYAELLFYSDWLWRKFRESWRRKAKNRVLSKRLLNSIKKDVR